MWPTVTWPAKPLTMFNPTARITLMAITLMTNCVYALLRNSGSGRRMTHPISHGTMGWILASHVSGPATAVVGLTSMLIAVIPRVYFPGRVAYNMFRSFPRKRESRTFFPWPWVPAFAGTSGIDVDSIPPDHALESEVGFEGNARQDARVEVLAALCILHENTGPIAVTALRGRLGAEVDRPRRETAVIFDIGECIANRGAIGLERRIRQRQLGVAERQFHDLRGFIGLAEIMVRATDLVFVLHQLDERLCHRTIVFAIERGRKDQPDRGIAGQFRHRCVGGGRSSDAANPLRNANLDRLLRDARDRIDLTADGEH